MSQLPLEAHFPSTHQSLLDRVRTANDDAAWSEFVEKYGLIVLRWCKRRIESQELAKEIALDLLIDLPGKLEKYRRNVEAGRFRGWLHTVVENGCIDLLRRRHRERNLLANLVKSDSMDELKEHLNLIFDQDVYDVACNIVIERLNAHSRGRPETWEAYRLTAPQGFFRGEGLSNEEAAKKLCMKISFVEKARSNVKQMLSEEINRMEQKR